jgi:hypothetical protein
MTATPTTEKRLIAFQTPQGTVPWLSPPPLPARGQSHASGSGYSIEFMSMPSQQRDAEAGLDDALEQVSGHRGAEPDLVDVLEQVSGLTLERPILQDKALQETPMRTPLQEVYTGGLLEQVSGLTLERPVLQEKTSQDYSLRTPLQDSRLLFTGFPPLPFPPTISSSTADSLTPALRYKRRSSHQCTPVESELDLTSPKNQRVAMIRPKRYRSNCSIVNKVQTCPLLPTSPDLSEAGEIRHEPCFSPVFQSSTAHLPTPSGPMLPLASSTTVKEAPPPPPPPPMPLFGSPNMDKRKVASSDISPLKIKMRKADSTPTWAFPHL